MKLHYNSPLILSYALVCTVVLFASERLGGSLVRTFFASLPNPNFADPLTWFRMFSHVIGHKDWGHLIGNFSFILLIGPVLEEKYGAKKLLIMMALAAGVTGLLNILFFHTGLVGASGIVFMFIILVSFTNLKSGEIPLTFILVVLLFLAKEVTDAFRQDSISQFAHIVGGICGSVFGFRMRK